MWVPRAVNIKEQEGGRGREGEEREDEEEAAEEEGEETKRWGRNGRGRSEREGEGREEMCVCGGVLFLTRTLKKVNCRSNNRKLKWKGKEGKVECWQVYHVLSLEQSSYCFLGSQPLNPFTLLTPHTLLNISTDGSSSRNTFLSLKDRINDITVFLHFCSPLRFYFP